MGSRRTVKKIRGIIPRVGQECGEGGTVSFQYELALVTKSPVNELPVTKLPINEFLVD
jgi:hypothetical protein